MFLVWGSAWMRFSGLVEIYSWVRIHAGSSLHHEVLLHNFVIQPTTDSYVTLNLVNFYSKCVHKEVQIFWLSGQHGYHYPLLQKIIRPLSSPKPKTRRLNWQQNQLLPLPENRINPHRGTTSHFSVPGRNTYPSPLTSSILPHLHRFSSFTGIRNTYSAHPLVNRIHIFLVIFHLLDTWFQESGKTPSRSSEHISCRIGSTFIFSDKKRQKRCAIVIIYNMPHNLTSTTQTAALPILLSWRNQGSKMTETVCTSVMLSNRLQSQGIQRK